MPIRQQSIIIFSATKSDDKCDNVMSFFKASYHNCYRWQQLFDEKVKDDNNRMILPMLIKKIPTFDFAIILSDSTDILEQEIESDKKIDTKKILEQKIEYKEGEIVKHVIRKYVMRDNVLFECGLCIMALGTDRVILLREKNTYIPPDLFSGFGKMGIETFEYNSDLANFNEKLKEVYKYIKEKASHISPIVIGAAISTADAYLSNFILRFWENIEKVSEEGKKNGFFTDLDTNDQFHLDVSHIGMSIIIPAEINSNLSTDINEYYKVHNYKRGITFSEGIFRGVEFRYKKIGNRYLVCDYPSTLTASFTTAKDILNLSADEKENDADAEKRFLLKERDSFVYTLKKLMTTESLKLKLATFKKDDTQIEELLSRMKQVEIIEK